MNSCSAWFNLSKRRVRANHRLTMMESLDLALVDPPSLCCDDDEMCPACRADSAPELVLDRNY